MLAIAAGLHFNLKVYIFCVKFVKGLQFVASVSQPSQACNRQWQPNSTAEINRETELMTTVKQNLNDGYQITFAATDQQVNVIEKCLIPSRKMSHKLINL